jgi:hypothetical protein
MLRLSVRHVSIGVPLSALLLAGASAHAEEPAAPVYVPEKADVAAELQPEGWRYNLDLGATFAFNHNSSVVGQPDGSMVTFGTKFGVNLRYLSGKHEWRGAFSLGESLSKTPNVDELIKTQDAAALESLYLHHTLSWLGPFVRVAGETALFAGADPRPTPVTYAIARPDGTVDEVVTQRLRLTDPLRPMTLKQSLGAFVDPYKSERLTVEVRLGAGGRETFAANQLAVADDAATPVIETKELESFAQVGAELVATAWGTFASSNLTYKLAFEAMTPLYHTDLQAGDTRGPLDLTNITLLAQLSTKITSFASLDYELKVVREPQLIDVVQVRNNLLLTLALSAASPSLVK